MGEQCICSSLCFASETELAILNDKRHHPACPLHMTEKRPRLFYYEETENCWAPVPDKVENIVAIDLLEDREQMEVAFKRSDMTDFEFYNMEEV